MPVSETDNEALWIEGELRLAGMDSRMIALLKAIEQSGSINQAAKQCGLSYKGAWQIIERANNLAPKVLIATATGGSKGGGTKLTAAGQDFLALFDRLERRHRAFLQALNQSLLDDPDLVLLLKRQVIKTSARNQLFGTIAEVRGGAVYAEVVVTLKGGEEVVASVAQPALGELPVAVGGEAVLLVNAPEIVVAAEGENHVFSARNRLSGTVIRVQYDGIDSEVILQLPSGETISAALTQAGAESLGLEAGCKAVAFFKSNAVILGVLPATDEGAPATPAF